VNLLPAGVTVALATPLGPDGDLDEAALDRLLDRVVAAGVVGVSPLGSTGEGARLSTATRRRVVAAVRARITLPVIAGLPVSTVDDARRELDALAADGVDGALVAAPSYYPATDSEINSLYSTLADDPPIPLVVYHIPPMTGIRISPAVVGDLAQHPRIVGMKDSSRDMEYIEAALYATADADFDIVTGSDTMLLASLVMGAHGTIAASANLVPELSVGIYDAFVRGDFDRARELQRQLFLIVQACRRGVPPSGWKAALEIAGVCSARMAAPGERLPGDAYELVKRDLAALLPDGGDSHA
jgi:4-hydroxy-tetrahydrodipicolinate synthase